MVGVVRYYHPCERSVNTKFDAVLRNVEVYEGT